MFDLHSWVLKAVSFPVEALLHSNHAVCFVITLGIAGYVSPLAFVLALFATLFGLFTSFGDRPCPLPRCRSSVDVLMGRSYSVSQPDAGMEANNNVTIVHYGAKLLCAYRKAPSHFASPLARLVVVQADTTDLSSWEVVWEYHTGDDDLREMLLFEFQNKLFLYFACLAPFKRGFEPRKMQWCSTTDLKVWSPPTDFGRVSEIVWDVKVHDLDGDGREMVYKASYIGNHYASDAVLTVLFERSPDGVQWSAVGDSAAVYIGGISEVTFAFTPSGDLVAIGRNEDGDATGFGSQLFFARKGDLGNWSHLKVSLPGRYDSPRMICLDGEMILFARYASAPYNLVPGWLPFGLQRFGNLVLYSLLPKAGAIYRVCAPRDGEWSKAPVELIRFIDGARGDTGFFSMAGVGTELYVANYTSFHCHSNAPWLYGQVRPTEVFVCRCQISLSA